MPCKYPIAKALSQLMRIFSVIGIVVLGCVLTSGRAISSIESTDEQLVAQLLDIDVPAVGLHPTVLVRAFIAENQPAKIEGGVIGSGGPKVYPQMQELVRRGVNSLPTLIKHLDDDRPTRLKVGGDFFVFRYFSDEYVPKVGRQNPNATWLERDFKGDYTVRIGDVCYVLIGQIVNRNLSAVRYQPSAGLVVNSPIEVPKLIDEVKRDWAGVGAESHMASLLTDARRGSEFWSYGPALERLRFYYPDEYHREAVGELKAKIRDFEVREKSQSKQN